LVGQELLVDTDTHRTEAPATATAVLPAPPEPSLPWPDRVGERLAREARALVHRGQGLGPDQRGAAGVIAVLLVFLVLVAVLGHA
jgi:hypothetical protein